MCFCHPFIDSLSFLQLYCHVTLIFVQASKQQRETGNDDKSGNRGATKRCTALPLARLAVVHESHWLLIQAKKKCVEFRSPRQPVVFQRGMFFLFSCGAESRRNGRSELLFATVSAIVCLTAQEAYTRFNWAAKACNLKDLTTMYSITMAPRRNYASTLVGHQETWVC